MTYASRRAFLATATATLTALPSRAAYRGLDKIHFGYAAITWGKEQRQAADDIAAAGFSGVQFRVDATTEFKPAELRDLLSQRKLTFVAMSSGELSIDPALEAEHLAKHAANAKFLHEAGGKYLQILDQLKPYPRSVSSQDCVRLGKLLTELGKRTHDLGVPMVYHNHMNTISESPVNLDIVMENSDPKYVKLLLDTAHTLAGGADPAKTIEKYHERIVFLHLKDVVDIPLDTEGAKYPFKFVELGQGKVNLPAVFSALEKVKFAGWAVVELDRVPDKLKTPLQCAKMSHAYLEKQIGVKFAI